MSWATAVLNSLRGPDDWWGFMVYRTTYESEQEWDYFKSVCNGMCQAAYKGSDDGAAARERLRLEMVEDPSLDGVDVEEVLRRFREHCWANDWSAGGRGRNQCCVMVDKRALMSVARRKESNDPAHVLLVDRQYDHNIGEGNEDQEDDQDEEEDEEEDYSTLRVVLSELLRTFYIDLLSDLQFHEMTSDLLVGE